jgi:hypothetical protein
MRIKDFPEFVATRSESGHVQMVRDALEVIFPTPAAIESFDEECALLGQNSLTTLNARLLKISSTETLNLQAQIREFRQMLRELELAYIWQADCGYPDCTERSRDEYMTALFFQILTTSQVQEIDQELFSGVPKAEL